MTKQIDRLRRDERFVVVEGDAVEYRYVWPSSRQGYATCVDQGGEWVMMPASSLVVVL